MSTSKARGLRRRSTEAERLLWRHLRNRQLGGYKFRRQHPIGPYIVDFACPDRNLAVELDGGQHAGQADYDARRSAWLASRGYRVLRFWDNQALRDIEAVKATIMEALEGPSP